MDAVLLKAYNKAKVGILERNKSTFICTVLFSLKLEFTADVPTAATDGENIFVNPEWFMALTPKERVFLLVHEAWHVAFSHPVRGEGKNAEIYNKAADYVINIMLCDEGFEFIKGGLKDDRFRNKSTEEVYKILLEETSYAKEHCTNGMGNDLMPASKKKAEELQSKIDSLLVKASLRNEMENDNAGDLPEEIKVKIQSLLNPTLPWDVLLINYMSAFAKEDFSFRRPNRRYLPDFYLASPHSIAMANLTIAVDTSASVSKEEFTRFISEIDYIHKTLKPVELTVLDFDVSIKGEHILNSTSDITDIDFKGRGGTSFKCIFNYLAKNPTNLLIVFSDMCCDKIKKEPDYPVLWVSVNNKGAEVNFGQLIHCEI